MEQTIYCVERIGEKKNNNQTVPLRVERSRREKQSRIDSAAKMSLIANIKREFVKFVLRVYIRYSVDSKRFLYNYNNNNNELII